MSCVCCVLPAAQPPAFPEEEGFLANAASLLHAHHMVGLLQSHVLGLWFSLCKEGFSVWCWQLIEVKPSNTHPTTERAASCFKTRLVSLPWSSTGAHVCSEQAQQCPCAHPGCAQSSAYRNNLWPSRWGCMEVSIALCLEPLIAFPSALPNLSTAVCQRQHSPHLRAGSVVPSLLGDQIKMILLWSCQERTPQHLGGGLGWKDRL